AEDGIRDYKVTRVQTCALPIWLPFGRGRHSYWSLRQLWTDALSRQPNFRRVCQRPMDLRRSGDARGDCWPCCLFASRTSRRESRPSRRPPLRIICRSVRCVLCEVKDRVLDSAISESSWAL